LCRTPVPLKLYNALQEENKKAQNHQQTKIKMNINREQQWKIQIIAGYKINENVTHKIPWHSELKHVELY
jgi:hypothetical protein